MISFCVKYAVYCICIPPVSIQKFYHSGNTIMLNNNTVLSILLKVLFLLVIVNLVIFPLLCI